MSEQHPEPLDGDALEALKAERLRPDPTMAARARVQARVLESLAVPSGITEIGPPPKAVSALAKLKLAGTMGAVFVAGAGVGAGVHAHYAAPSPAPAPIQVVAPANAARPAEVAPPQATAASLPPPATVDPIDSIEESPGPAPMPSASERQRTGDSDLKAERALLDRAREAFVRGDDASAMTVLDAHAQRFSAGRLVEEREALAIKALVNLGRGEEARKRGERFRARFPKSLLLPTVDNALRTNP